LEILSHRFFFNSKILMREN